MARENRRIHVYFDAIWNRKLGIFEESFITSLNTVFERKPVKLNQTLPYALCETYA